MASTAVVLLKKLADPVAPKSSTRGAATKSGAHVRTPALNQHETTPPKAARMWTTRTTENRYSMSSLYFAAALQIARKSAATRDAPPIRPPSISGIPRSSTAFEGFMLPPYRICKPPATAASACAICARIAANFLGLLGSRRAAGTNRPNRLIGNNRVRERSNTHPLQHCVNLRWTPPQRFALLHAAPGSHRRTAPDADLQPRQQRIFLRRAHRFRHRSNDAPNGQPDIPAGEVLEH